MIKNKCFRNIILSLAMIAITVTSTFVLKSKNVTAQENKSAEIVQSITRGIYGSVLPLQGKNIYNDIFEENLTAYQDNNYVYLFNENGTSLKSIILLALPEKSLYGTISSSAQAEQNAATLLDKVSSQIITDNNYDIISREHGSNGNKKYTIEFWEKIENKFYSGNKAAIILTADGCLDSMVSRYVGYYRSNYSDYEFIQENDAIDKAYQEVESIAANLEKIENQKSLAKQNTEGKASLSDDTLKNQTKEAEKINDKTFVPYEINLDNPAAYTTASYREVSNGTVEWVIQFLNVPTNKYTKKINFIIKMNARTGETKFIDYTR